MSDSMVQCADCKKASVIKHYAGQDPDCFCFLFNDYMLACSPRYCTAFRQKAKKLEAAHAGV